LKIGIRAKIVGSFLTLTLIFILCLGIVSLVVRDLTTTIQQMHEVERKVELATHLQLQVDKLLDPANNYLITGNIGERDNFDRLINELSETINEIQQQKGNQEWENLADRINQDTLELSEILIAVLFINHPVGNPQAVQGIQKANRFSEGLIEKAAQFNLLSEREMMKMNETAILKGSKVQFVFYGTIGVAILFLGLLSLYLSQSIIQPMLQLHQGVQIVASGRLDHRLSIKTSDEIGKLALEFNRMVQALSDMRRNLDLKLEETHQLAITDALTGLYNQRFCMGKMIEEINRAERFNRPLSIITADIDNFKLYNDTHGHLRGDDLLRLFGSVLKQQMRTADFVCRTGGEEFIIILPETDKAEALQIAERLRTTIEKHPFPYKETQPGRRLTVSLGIASYTKGQMDLHKLMKAADEALYQAKRRGKNRVAILT
jgi:diguanylate cyclase (GGDEF)-like protein